jgi:hypothetical protein
LIKFVFNEHGFLSVKVVEALGNIEGEESKVWLTKSPLVRANPKGISNLVDFRFNSLRKQTGAIKTNCEFKSKLSNLQFVILKKKSAIEKKSA